MKVSDPTIKVDFEDGTPPHECTVDQATKLYVALGKILAYRPGPGLENIRILPAVVPLPPTLSGQENLA